MNLVANRPPCFRGMHKKDSAKGPQRVPFCTVLPCRIFPGVVLALSFRLFFDAVPFCSQNAARVFPAAFSHRMPAFSSRRMSSSVRR